MTSYLGVTVHWIDEDWRLHSEVLSFAPIDGIHTGENQSVMLYQIIVKFGITKKVSLFHVLLAIAKLFQVLACTSDSAPANDATMRCLADILFKEHLILSGKAPLRSRYV